jgi:hypothetical protein
VVQELLHLRPQYLEPEQRLMPQIIRRWTERQTKYELLFSSDFLSIDDLT